MSLPALQDLNTPLSKEQLEILHQQVLDEGELVSVQSQFNYAWGLIKSKAPEDTKLGIKTLTDLFKTSPQRRRECLYYLALGTFKIADYSNSRRYIQSLIALEPENKQFQDLQKTVDEKIAKDGIIGIALISGVVALGATAASLIFKRRR